MGFYMGEKGGVYVRLVDVMFCVVSFDYRVIVVMSMCLLVLCLLMICVLSSWFVFFLFMICMVMGLVCGM